jgi:uncharacterized protein YeeX (DUF496 family)
MNRETGDINRVRDEKRIEKLLFKNSELSRRLLELDQQVKESSAKITFDEMEFVKESSRVQKDIELITSFYDFEINQMQLMRLGASIESKKKDYEGKKNQYEMMKVENQEKESLKYKDSIRENKKLLEMCFDSLNNLK